MGNINYSSEQAKYKLMARIEVDGVVSKGDIIGALFGQTEGLLDQDMELKQLQKSGRIGRIELDTNNRSGQTKGTISVPSSLNKIETAIIAATLESVDRVGACSCEIELERIVDVRKDKRDQIAKRASEIMKQWEVDKQSEQVDISSLVEKDTKRGRLVTFGSEKLPAGPGIFDAKEIILVEGRADILNLLKQNIDNTIALSGTNVSSTINNLCKKRTVTALLDGDRGGDMILKELLLNAEIEYIARAPRNQEIEDLDHGEVKHALNNKTPILDAEFISEKFSIYDFLKRNKRWNVINKNKKRSKKVEKKTQKRKVKSKQKRKEKSKQKQKKKTKRKKKEKKRRDTGIRVPKKMHSIIDDTKQTMNAVLLNDNFDPIDTISTADLFEKVKSLDNSVNSIVIDGVITQRLLNLADKKNIKLIAGAVVGEITKTPRTTKYVTFNKI